MIWPGYLKRVPKGWEMPTDEKRLKIGIPANTSFDKFVKVDEAQIDPEKKYTGFCIDIFREVIKILEQNYSLPYDFHPYDGTYDELVDRVYTKVIATFSSLLFRFFPCFFFFSILLNSHVVIQAKKNEHHVTVH